MHKAKRKSNQPRICVVGACNVDLTSYTKRMPLWGETLKGFEFELSFGGKGANQAAMAAKLGASVSMISAIGDDLLGQGILDNMKQTGIEVSNIKQVKGARSSVAQIIVDENGKNAIILTTNASDFLSLKDLHLSRPDIDGADILLVQWEIPLEISLEAMRIAKESGTTVIFNPAPIQGSLPKESFVLCDILCVNETEIEALTSINIENKAEARGAMEHIQSLGVKNVILTLGKYGVRLLFGNDFISLEAQKVKAIDTTGAGDCFIASFSYFHALGVSNKDCISIASKIAGLSVQKKGTQNSYPDMKTISQHLGELR